MNIKPIRTNSDYDIACERLYKLMHSTSEPLQPGTVKGDEAELLSILIDDYEKKMGYKITAPDPVELIKFRMEEKGLRQVDLIPYLGSSSRVSEILNRRRRLTINIIKKLCKPLDLLPYQLIHL